MYHKTNALRWTHPCDRCAHRTFLHFEISHFKQTYILLFCIQRLVICIRRFPNQHTESSFKNLDVCRGLWFLILHRARYRVSHKKDFHMRQEKMHKKMKMTSQRVENLVHVQQHHGRHLYKKCFSNVALYSWYGHLNVEFWQFWYWPNIFKTCSEIVLWL